MNKVMDIAKKYKLFVIEDCAQAHGAKYKGRYVGTFGDISCFSFYQTKNLSCGEGGMVITRSKELYEKCNSVVDHGLINGNLQGYDYDRLGYNYHLSEIQAAIGLVQLHKLKRLNSERIQNANLYKKHLLNTGLVFQKDTAEAENVFYCLTALLPEKFKNKRDWFVDALRAENVEINKIYPVSLHQTKLFKRHSKNTYPISTDVTSRLFNFYTNPGISKKYIVNTCRAINKVLNYLENND
jgi:perosamine synthetase